MDLNAYFAQLDEHTAATVNLARSLPADQLDVKPDGRWSLLEILEHIGLTERMVMTFLGRPSEQYSDKAENLGRDKLHRATVERRLAFKVEAPEWLRPRGQVTDIATFEQVFTSQRQQFRENLANGTIPVDNRVYKHPVLGDLTVSDWLHFLICHTQRHLDQIRDRLTETTADQPA